MSERDVISAAKRWHSARHDRLKEQKSSRVAEEIWNIDPTQYQSMKVTRDRYEQARRLELRAMTALRKACAAMWGGDQVDDIDDVPIKAKPLQIEGGD